MGVWRIPMNQDPMRRLPKPPYVEKRKCKAFRCKNRRSTSFPWIKDNPWCTEHSRKIYYATESWMSVAQKQRVQQAAMPPTTLFAWLRCKPWRKK